MVRLKRTALVLLVSLCLLSILPAASSRFNVRAQSVTWTVDWNGSGDFTSIRDALNSKNVSSEDTIFVNKGIYNESVEINKSISLVGEDRDNTIINGDSEAAYVILINSINNVSVQNFTIEKSGVKLTDSGIYIISSGSMVSHNKIIGISEGIIIVSSINNSISDNIILFNNDAGIYMLFSSSNTFLSNTISNNQRGISISGSRGNVFADNTISDNQEGVSTSSRSTINVFYHNNFVNNGVHASTDGFLNYWNNYGEGNYWSNYTGQDSRHDGTGDLPYVIDVNNIDNKPLVGMFSGFNVVSANEIYQVDIVSNSTVSDFNFEIGVETGNKVITFSVSGEKGTVGFSRIAIPIALMNYSLVLVNGEEIFPTPLDKSSSEDYLYFTYPHTKQIVTIISSMTFNLYEDLFAQFRDLQTNWNFLNLTYFGLLNSYGALLGNFSQLQQSYMALNASYQDHLSDHSQSLENVRSLMYIFAGTTAVFIVTTIYLSRRQRSRMAAPFESNR